MDEEEVLEPEQEEGYEDLSDEDKIILSDKKLKKLRNLKYFRKYSNEQILEWYKKRHGNEAPPEDPADLNAGGEETPAPVVTSSAVVTFDPEEYKKKYNAYLAKYRKEYSVDMNETNDAEALKTLIRLMIQSERADELIMKEQHASDPDHRTLKGLGDFQRSLQMSVNEIQDKLGISRKARKEKQVDDIPQYIRGIQQKAKDFWERKTVAVRCDKCKIELARYWLNFPDKVERVNFEVTCDKCDSKISFVE